MDNKEQVRRIYVTILKLGAIVTAVSDGVEDNTYNVFLRLPDEVKHAYTSGRMKDKYVITEHIVPYTTYCLTPNV